MSTESRTPHQKLDFAAVFDRLGEGILVFDAEGQLVLDNESARQILAANMVVIRQQGWQALALLVDKTSNQTVDDIRTKALRQTDPIRFHIMLSDAYIPCWASGIHQEDGQPFTVISVERPDWTPMIELMSSFRKEAIPAMEDAAGHAKFIIQIATRRKEDMTADQLAERVIGFSELIATEMNQLQTLTQQLHRLEIIRTGKLTDVIKQSSRKIDLEDFMEDFMEELAGTKGEATRDRIRTDIESDLYIKASRPHLTTILRNVLQNAFMYSPADSPVQMRAFPTNKGQYVQIDITDQGCGIRESEYDRVFGLFQRARQPHVIAEFGYGISMALAKADMEAMGGRIWFTSEEAVTTTFSLKLPAYQDDDASES